jgi:ATP-dependent DNA ligase
MPTKSSLPQWIPPQLAQLVEKAPSGAQWLHEIKLDVFAWRRAKSPLNVPPPRSTRFGSPLVLSRVHWVEPKFVAEITFLTWTADNLLRQTVYVGLREDKPAEQVRRELKA